MSPWSLLKPSGGLEVDTEIVAGDKEITTEVGTENVQAGRIETVVMGLSKIELIVFALLAGWAIPGPYETLRGLLLGLRMVWRTIRGRRI